MENQGSVILGEVAEVTVDFCTILIDVAHFKKPETFFFLLYPLCIFLHNIPGE